MPRAQTPRYPFARQGARRFAAVIVVWIGWMPVAARAQAPFHALRLFPPTRKSSDLPEEISSCGATVGCVAGALELTSESWSRSSLSPVPEAPPSVGRFAHRLVFDVGPFFASPLHLSRRQWGHLAAGLALVGVARALDDPLRTQVRKDSDDAEDLQVARSYRPVGLEGGLVLLGGAWVAGRALHRPGLVSTAQDGLEAIFLAAGVVAPMLKAVTGRARPREGAGSSSFHLFGGSASFPSGEVTEAFAIASTVAAHTDRRWLKGLAWALAAGTGWERMRLDAHWSSDVVAGALLGAAVGRWIVHRHGPRATEGRPGPHLDLVPGADAGGYGLTFRLAW